MSFLQVALPENDMLQIENSRLKRKRDTLVGENMGLEAEVVTGLKTLKLLETANEELKKQMDTNKKEYDIKMNEIKVEKTSLTNENKRYRQQNHTLKKELELSQAEINKYKPFMEAEISKIRLQVDEMKARAEVAEAELAKMKAIQKEPFKNYSSS